MTLPPEGGQFSDSLANLNLVDLLLVELAEVSTEGTLGANGFAASEATLTNLALDDLLAVEALEANCNADLDGVSGATNLLNGEVIIIGGLPVAPAPNTVVLDLDATAGPLTVQASLVLNEQFGDDDDITVNGLHLALNLVVDLDGTPFQLLGADLIASHASCGITPVEVVEPVPVPIEPRFTG